MMIGGVVTIVEAAGTTLISSVSDDKMPPRQMPPSSGQANDAWAPDDPQVDAPGPQAEQPGQKVQLPPGYSGTPFFMIPSQS